MKFAASLVAVVAALATLTRASASPVPILGQDKDLSSRTSSGPDRDWPVNVL
ncbi:hypothetical protein COEREDRAFT_79178 [Coemansia reversa NRRL 1564]|uniref:Uncharacterized protein n=1 Tax=Coemansia reversa (strain ATCC 12441 / NRRL 1564) TaxID=763665 RepID=A0A2G5BJL3_COERN|nr:hypothetical protein COEREDRAFT_79178 [Coemansia reversa NRRL 1564]|eukprot:PIA19224.1 hypothetical protein COEREDRAFT_79178 [Coemansia reversa NRRL 1564]